MISVTLAKEDSRFTMHRGRNRYRYRNRNYRSPRADTESDPDPDNCRPVGMEDLGYTVIGFTAKEDRDNKIAQYHHIFGREFL